MLRSAGLAIVFVVFSSGLASAQTPRLLGSHDRWSTWTFREGRTKICYVHSDAVAKKPETLDHGRVGFSVRWHANGVIRTEAGFMAGYEFAPRAIRVTIDGRSFAMIPRGKNAWLRREEREAEFVRSLTKGRTMTVEAVSKRGNKTSYRFSLTGVAAALHKAGQSCP